MKHYSCILTLLLVGFFVNPISKELSASTMSVQQFDKRTIIKKILADAQKNIAKGQYLAAQKSLNSLLRLDPKNSKAKELLGECREGIMKQKQQIHEIYLRACETGTINSLESFISNYPNSEYVFQAKQRIKDYNSWKEAKEQNTINAYNSYLANSSILAYEEEANEAIKNIQIEAEWNDCNDEEQLNAFIQKYPNSSLVNQARHKLNILKGEKCYAENNYTLAYLYLTDANNFQALSGLPAQHYKTIIDKREFDDIMVSSNIERVKNYLKTLSLSSTYYNPTSNRLAFLLGASLNVSSSEDSMEEALSYAKDSETKSLVMQYIDKVKSDQSYYAHLRKIAARKAWWEHRFMVGWNVFHIDYFDKVLGVGTGVKLRMGRWSDVINLLFGAEYSYLVYIPKLNIQAEDFKALPVSHAVELPLGLRFNLFRVGTYSKFYIGCNAAFGFNLSEGKHFRVNKQSISIEPQFGFASKNLDFGIYYKRYLKDHEVFKDTNKYNQRIGCFFTWFI